MIIIYKFSHLYKQLNLKYNFLNFISNNNYIMNYKKKYKVFFENNLSTYELKIINKNEITGGDAKKAIKDGYNTSVNAINKGFEKTKETFGKMLDYTKSTFNNLTFNIIKHESITNLDQGKEAAVDFVKRAFINSIRKLEGDKYSFYLRPYDLRIFSRYSTDSILSLGSKGSTVYLYSISEEYIKKGMLLWINSMNVDNYKLIYEKSISSFNINNDKTYLDSKGNLVRFSI